jgi:hypothetical protein
MYIAVALCLPRQGRQECSFNLSTLPGWHSAFTYIVQEPPTHGLCELLNSITGEVVIKQIDQLGITLSISVTKLKKESLARTLKEESPAPCAEMVEKWN